jgi:competence protein ComEA
VTVAVLIASGLLSLMGWWIVHGGTRGRTVNIERADLQTARFQVDINKAQWPELATLPGVGQRLAERIVQSREQNGPYADIDDLRRVRGIGARTLETLRPYLRPMPRRQAVAGE